MTFPKKRHQVVIQYQMVSPEDIHGSNIIQTKQVTFRNIYNIYLYVYAYTYLHAITINERRGHKFKGKLRGG